MRVAVNQIMPSESGCRTVLVSIFFKIRSRGSRRNRLKITRFIVMIERKRLCRAVRRNIQGAGYET